MPTLEGAGGYPCREDSTLDARRDLVYLAGCALALRLVAAVFWAPAPTGDAAEYLRLAEGLLAGRGFTDAQGALTSWRPPLYPALLTPLLATRAWWGEAGALTLVRVTQALLSSLTVLMVYTLGAVVGGRRTARWAAVLLALSVSHVAAVSRLLSETLFTFLIVATVVLLVHATRPSRPSRPASAFASFAVAGAVLGLGALVRSVALALPLVLVPTLLLSRRRLAWTRPRVVVGIAGFSLGFMLVLTPWTVRNHRLHDALVPVATQGGATLYAGNHPQGGRVLGVMADDDRTRHAANMTEVEASAYLTAMTIQDWKDDPPEAVRLAVLKTLYFWTPEDWEILPGSGGFNPTYAFVMLWVLWLLVGSGGSRELRTTSWGWRLWPAWSISLAFVGLSLVFYGSPRLRFPIEPFLVILAAAGILSVERRQSPGRTRRAVAVAVTASLSAFLVWSPVGSAIKAALGVVGVW